MTDTAGTPPDVPDPSGDDAPTPVPPDAVSDTPEAPEPSEASAASEASPASAGTHEPEHPHWARWISLVAAVVVLVTSGVGWGIYKQLQGNITEDLTAAEELERYERERPAPSTHNAQNVLLIGSDTRTGDGNDKYGKDSGTNGGRSDTTILLHLAADRKSATAVSLPRDVMVDIPSCRKRDGSRTKEQFAQFNWAFEWGGAACTIRTIEQLTDIRIDHHMVVDFRGFKKMVDAVDGVEVCVAKPIDDRAAKLKLAKGRHKLNGEQALGYVRARKTLGDGSDTERMDRQQAFLAALVNKVKSNGVLLNPTRLYPVLDAATSSLTTDPAIAQLTDLYDLVRSMRNIPADRVQFLTVPRQSYAYDANRDELVQPDAGRLFDRLREDAPLQVAENAPSAEQAAAEREGEEPASERDGAEDGGGGYWVDTGYWSDEGYWVDDGYWEEGKSSDEDPQDGKGKKSEKDRKSESKGDPKNDKPDEPSAQTPSPAPTFRGSTAAGAGC
ncbi:LCP family protein [Streptomyces sp. NPDC050418]|uniref:LCP family protein n=1 Tax=Streptomyces sp. NPDC050418 TaxID=3365612 RepID=UPI0037AC27A5